MRQLYLNKELGADEQRLFYIKFQPKAIFLT